MRSNDPALGNLLEELYERYHNPSFIDSDPVSVPHLFSRKEDIEISGFLTAILSWGNRKSIIRSARHLVGLMDDAPFDFLVNLTGKEKKRFGSFQYRTFNPTDCLFFLEALRDLYRYSGGLEPLFSGLNRTGNKETLVNFRRKFLSFPHPARSEKHLSDPARGSSCKRIHLFLRWMVRRDGRGVDFGLWKKIDPSHLLCPLDVHSANAARRLGLLKRKSNDWKAVEELTAKLREFDPSDPVRYDFAMFGAGIRGDQRLPVYGSKPD